MPRVSGFAVNPIGGVSGMRSADHTASPDGVPRAVALAPVERRRTPRSTQMFELRCENVHPVCCAASWRAGRAADVVVLARGHGALAHGFTPVWYSETRMDLIAAAVTRRAS